MDFNTLPQTPQPYGIRCGQGPRFHLGGMVASIYASGAQTEGSFGLTMLTGGRDAGLPLLRHATAHAGLYVLDGVIELTLAGQRYALVRGDYASIPAGTDWGLRMDRLRNVAMLFKTGAEAVELPRQRGVPCTGFVQPDRAPGSWRDLAPGAVPGCDTDILGPLPDTAPAGTPLRAVPQGTEPYVILSGEGDHVLVADQLFTYTSRNRNTGGQFFTLLTEGPAGPMIPPHKHLKHDEMFFCVDGELTMLAGDETVQLRAGDFLFVRRGTPHAYQFTQPYTRLMGWLKPGIFEPFFDILGDPTDTTVYPQVPPPFRFDRVLTRLGELDIVPLGGGRPGAA